MTDVPVGVSGFGIGADEVAVRGRIAARIDRLPLMAFHYRYAIITQLCWGIVFSTDLLIARLYPFLWEPHHIITPLEFNVIFGANAGVGIMIGEQVGGWFSDKFGRKKCLIAAGLVNGVFFWPMGYTSTWYVLLTINLLYAIGIGMVLPASQTYIQEMSPPRNRQRMLMRAQSTALVFSLLVGGITAYYWIPGHYRWFVWFMTIANVIVLPIMVIFALPESPRWLEGKGKIEAAEKLVATWEQKAREKFGTLPPLEENTVIQTERVPWLTLFGRTYRSQTVYLTIGWFLGYSGIIYGLSSYFPTFAVIHAGWDAHQLFLWTSIIPTPFFVATLYIVGTLGERYQRRDLQFVGGGAFALVALGLLIWGKNSGYLAFVAIAIVPTSQLWLFTLYNYTTAAYPTRLRSVGTGWVDGVGHLGVLVGTALVAGQLFTLTLASGAYGWILYCAIPGAIVPIILLRVTGKKQSGALEVLSQ